VVPGDDDPRWDVSNAPVGSVFLPTHTPTETAPPTMTPTITETPTPTDTPTATATPFGVILTAHIEPAEPGTWDDLECVTMIDDPLSRDLVTSYRWFRDGEELLEPLEIGEEIFPATDSALSRHFTTRYQVFSCVVRVTDGLSSVETETEAVTVVNSPPTAPVIVILPEEPVPGDGLAVWVMEPSVDPDGDAVGLVFQWFESSDGVNWNLRTEMSGRIDPYDRGEPEVSGLYTQMSEFWRVDVFPVEFGIPAGKAGASSPEYLAGLAVESAGDPVTDTVYVLPDLSGDRRVDGEDLAVLMSLWHRTKADLDSGVRPWFFESSAPPTSVIGPEFLFRLGIGGWHRGSGE